MHRYLSAAVLIATLVAAPAHAQWTANGFGIAVGSPIEFHPAACTDGANGAFVAWVDCRNGLNTDLYLQRLQSDGAIAAGWPAGGLGLVLDPEAQTLPVVAAEPSGGCWLAWADYRSGGIDVYLTRVLADGSLAAGWPANGLAVAAANSVRTEPSLLPDGSGGVYVAWSQNAGGLQKDLQLMHVAGDGSAVPGWTDGGLALSTDTNANVASTLCPDGSGGVYACWQELGATATVWLRRAAADGTFPAGWSSPLAVFPALVAISSAQAVPAASGGCLVVAGLSTGGPSGLDVWVQRLAADGTVAAGWSPTGHALCTASNAQQHARAIADGSGGTVVVWEDLRNAPDPELFASHIDGSGSTGPWPVQGLPLVSTPVRGTPSLALDGMGNFIAFTEDAFGGGSDLRAAGLSLTGASIPGWGADGNLVCAAAGEQMQPIAVPSDAGSAIVVWTDLRSGSAEDVYAGKMTSDGNVPALASLVRASATPGAVDLEWYVPGESRPIAIERSEDGHSWRFLGESAADGEGHVRWRDTGVVAGGAYDYRLGLDGARTLGLTHVQVPLAPGFALASPWPNPVRGAWSASFALEDDGPATLSLLDPAGRVVDAREVGTYGAGRHALAFDAAALRPGLYFVRLVQGARDEVRRLVVAP
jgi:hypothetical protein